MINQKNNIDNYQNRKILKMTNKIMFSEIIIKTFIVIWFVICIYSCIYIIKNTIQPSGSVLYGVDTIKKKNTLEQQLELERSQRLYYKIQQMNTTDIIEKPTVYLDDTSYNNNNPLYSERNDIQNIRNMQIKLRRDKRRNDARLQK